MHQTKGYPISFKKNTTGFKDMDEYLYINSQWFQYTSFSNERSPEQKPSELTDIIY